MNKSQYLEQYRRFLASHGEDTRDLTVDDLPICTCDDCEDNKECKYAWDMYNTDGDCLAGK